MVDRKKRSKVKTKNAQEDMPESCENLKLEFTFEGKQRIFIGQNGVYNHCLDVIRIWQTDLAHTIIAFKQISIEPRTILWSKVEQDDHDKLYLKYLDEILEKNKLSITTVEMDLKKLSGHSSESGESDYDYHDEEPIERRIRLKKVKNLNKIVALSTKDLIKANVFDISQILNTGHVDLLGTNLSFRQILRFEGTHLRIKSNGFITNNIREYLRTWMNGQLNIEYLYVKMKRPRDLESFKVTNGFPVIDFVNTDEEFSFLLPSSNSKQETVHCKVVCSRTYFTLEKITRDVVV